MVISRVCGDRMIREFFVVSKRLFKGKFVTPEKKEADQLLEPGTTVDCYKDGKYWASYGCVSATEIESDRQIENKQKKFLQGR